MTILTHCYPTTRRPYAGIFIQRAFGGLPVIRTGKLGGLLAGFVQARTARPPIIACWMFPAGVLAWLSRRPYVVYCIGLDCFLVERHGWLAWLMRPVLTRAKALVFCSRRGLAAFEGRYGDEYSRKSRVIRFPVMEGSL